MAVSFLVKMANYPIVADYLSSILQYPISLNSIDVVSRVTKASKVPLEYLETYTLKNMKEAIELTEANKDRGKLPRIIAIFIRTLAKNKLLDMSKHETELNSFIHTFPEV